MSHTRSYLTIHIDDIDDLPMDSGSDSASLRIEGSGDLRASYSYGGLTLLESPNVEDDASVCKATASCELLESLQSGIDMPTTGSRVPIETVSVASSQSQAAATVAQARHSVQSSDSSIISPFVQIHAASPSVTTVGDQPLVLAAANVEVGPHSSPASLHDERAPLNSVHSDEPDVPDVAIHVIESVLNPIPVSTSSSTASHGREAAASTVFRLSSMRPNSTIFRIPSIRPTSSVFQPPNIAIQATGPVLTLSDAVLQSRAPRNSGKRPSSGHLPHPNHRPQQVLTHATSPRFRP
ncbi:hypothetical protein BC830DRAFT_1093338 [Chytriomyces sp. MP71]|nr:hypothetical protein BC830DRAFT_1093338 [Chytriomyces sp. MP71]